MLVFKVLVWFGLVTLGVILAAGFAGSIHPIGDSFAVFRAQGAGLLLISGIFAFALMMRKTGAIAGIMALLLAVPIIFAYLRGGPSGEVMIYQKNLLYIDSDLAAIAADIRQIAPDFVTLQEVSDRNRLLLGELRDAYPAQFYCELRGVVVLSRFSAIPGQTVCEFGLSAMQVETGDGALWVISIHLLWPWPFDQAAHVTEIARVIEGLEGPKVIAGDFNMVPWSYAMQQVTEAGEVQFAQPVRGTFPQFGPLVTLPIDHVMTPTGGSTELRPLFGSDHHGLLVRFDLP